MSAKNRSDDRTAKQQRFASVSNSEEPARDMRLLAGCRAIDVSTREKQRTTS